MAHVATAADKPEFGSTFVKLLVLGAPRVGKTALIRQFVHNDYPDTYRPTRQRQAYFPTVMLGSRVLEVRLVDLPPFGNFPKDALDEWNRCRGYGVRSATAYILVFDITRADSFRYIKHARHHINKLDEPKPILVIGNKYDLLDESLFGESSELANIIQKHWKCSYVECSAKYNWHVSQCFQEILSQVETQCTGTSTLHVPTGARAKKCVVQ